MALATFFKYVDSIVLANPDRERWYKLPKSNEKNDEKRTEDDKGTVALHGFCERFRWAAELATSNRYPGWSQEVKNTPFEVEYGYPRW